MGNFNCDVQQLQEWIDQGLTRAQIAKLLHVAPCVVTKHCKRLGVFFKRKGNPRKDAFQIHPEINEEWLRKHWMTTNKSLYQLSVEFNIPLHVLESRRSTYNLQKHFLHPVNLNKLLNAEDPTVWYLAGLLVTDGYFPKVSDCFEITLKGPSEKILLEDIKSYFEASAPIQEYVKEQYRLRICGPGIKEFFQNVCNVNLLNKTYTADVPKTFPSNDCAYAYIRGCIDGDGHFNKNCDSLRLVTASEIFIKNFGNLLEKYVNVSVKYFIQKSASGKTFPGLKLCVHDVQKLYKKIYPEHCLCLQRKYLQCKNKFEGEGK